MNATPAPSVVLASSSPRRRDLLMALGLSPEIVPADIDETPQPGEKPAELVERLARAKAEAVVGRVSTPSLVIAADTVIDLDDVVLGKPVDRADAAATLRSLSGRPHRCLTGMAVALPAADPDGEARIEVGVEITDVWMRTIDDDEIAWYVASGEADGKAGSYAIQGLASLFVDRIEGSYHNVVGLPTAALDRLTRSAGWPLRLLAQPSRSDTHQAGPDRTGTDR